MGNNLKSKVLDTSIRDSINKKINDEYKISNIERPVNILPFPDDVTVLSSDEVGRYLAMYDAEVAYIRSILANVEAQIKYAEVVLNTHKKMLYLQFRSDSSAVDSNAWVDVDKDVVAAELALQELRIEQGLLQSRLENFMKYSASISREISRRKNEFFGVNEKISGASNKGDVQAERIKAIKGKDFKPNRNKSS